MKRKQNWQGKVYRKPLTKGVKFFSRNWIRTRNKVFKRDKFQCKWCDNFFGEYGLQLTAHHLEPRPKGKTIMSNLITLCNDCHNFVEGNDCATSDLLKKIGLIQVSKIYEGKNWRKWVYGGMQRP